MPNYRFTRQRVAPSVIAQRLTQMAGPSPWAILLCNFKDTPQQSPTPQALYERLFTTAGNGTFNAIRYFRDVSHGLLDLSGSQVFNGLTVDAMHNDYTAPTDPPPPGWMPKISRHELTSRARKAAKGAGIPLSNFYGDVIIFNVAIGGAFGSTGVPYSGSEYNRPYACSDYRSTSTAVYGHEMGHAYGLQHSRLQGSTEDYRDPWDIMSALATFFEPNDLDFGSRGPGLNAANMRALGWWDDARIWRPSSSAFSAVIELRPLFRRDLNGFLAAELPAAIGGYVVEYRKREDWDSGIPRSAVLIHRFYGGQSYLCPGTTGRPDLGQGDRFGLPQSTLPFVPRFDVEVIRIDDAADIATIRLTRTPAEPLPRELPAGILGSIAVDGGGGIIINGKFIPVPPWNPMARILTTLSELPTQDHSSNTHLLHALQRDILTRAVTQLQTLIQEIDSFGAPNSNMAKLLDRLKTQSRIRGTQRGRKSKRLVKKTG